MTTTSSNYILTIFFAHFLPLCVDVVSGDQFSSEKEDTLVQTSYVLTQKGVGVTLLNEREREREREREGKQSIHSRERWKKSFSAKDTDE